MTQDQTGQAQGTGYAREQALNDETEAGQSGAVTRLKKVASALRGDRPDEPVTDQTVPDVPDQTVPDQRAPAETVPDEMAMTSRDTQTQAEDSGRDAPVDDRADPEYAAGTRPGGIGSGDLGSGDFTACNFTLDWFQANGCRAVLRTASRPCIGRSNSLLRARFGIVK